LIPGCSSDRAFARGWVDREGEPNRNDLALDDERSLAGIAPADLTVGREGDEIPFAATRTDDRQKFFRDSHH
jgi:hypothetical protein